jgi:hypothetical protein
VKSFELVDDDERAALTPPQTLEELDRHVVFEARQIAHAIVAGYSVSQRLEGPCLAWRLPLSILGQRGHELARRNEFVMPDGPISQQAWPLEFFQTVSISTSRPKKNSRVAAVNDARS